METWLKDKKERDRSTVDDRHEGGKEGRKVAGV